MQVSWYEIGSKIKYAHLIISPKIFIIIVSDLFGTTCWLVPYLLKIQE